jgi:hypothetical protein
VRAITLLAGKEKMRDTMTTGELIKFVNQNKGQTIEAILLLGDSQSTHRLQWTEENGFVLFNEGFETEDTLEEYAEECGSPFPQARWIIN